MLQPEGEQDRPHRSSQDHSRRQSTRTTAHRPRVGPVTHGGRQRGQRGAEVERNRREYLRYLDGVDRAAAGTARRQYDDDHRLHPDPDTLWAIAGSAPMRYCR